VDKILGKCAIGINIILGIIFLIYYIISGDIYIRCECVSYAATAVALENHFSEWITLEDLEDAKKDFPEFANDFITENLHLEASKPEENLYKGYYAGLYSLLVLPAKRILSFTNISQSHAFAITNAILLIGTGIFLIKSFNKNKLLAFWLVIFNPIIFYIRWIGAEVFIYSVILISLIFFIKKKYKVAFLFSIFGGIMNAVVLFWSVVIGITYVIDKGQLLSEKIILDKIKTFIKCNWKDMIYFLIIGLIGYYGFFGNGVEKFGGGNLVFKNVLHRMFYYLFDTNMGVLPYYAPFFILFIVCFIKAIKAKNLNTCMICIGFFVVLFGYSLKVQICSDCNAIARYNSWNSVFMIVAVISFINLKDKRLLYYLIISTIFVISVTFSYESANNYTEYDKFTKFTTCILNNVPELYCGHEYVFSTCVKKEQQDLLENQVYVYVNYDGIVTKVLCHSTYIENLDKYINISEEKINKLKSKYFSKEQYLYLTFNPKEKIYKK